MSRKPNQHPQDYYATEYISAGGKTILHFCDPFSGRVQGPFTQGEGREPKVAEILDAAIDAFHEFGKQVGETVSVEFKLPSGRHLRFQGTPRENNIVFFEPLRKQASSTKRP